MKLYSIIYSKKLDKLFVWPGLLKYVNTESRRMLGVIEAVSPEMALYRWLNLADIE